MDMHEKEQKLLRCIESTLNQNGISIKKIPHDRQYWYIRTYDGIYFETFIKNKAVALGWKWEKNLDPHSEISDSMREKYWDILSNETYSKIEPHDLYAVDNVANRITSLINKANNKAIQHNKKQQEYLALGIDVRTYVEKAIKSRSLAKIIKFERGLSIGDIVMIPNNGATMFMIGEIISDVESHELNNKLFKKENQKECAM